MNLGAISETSKFNMCAAGGHGVPSPGRIHLRVKTIWLIRITKKNKERSTKAPGREYKSAMINSFLLILSKTIYQHWYNKTNGPKFFIKPEQVRHQITRRKSTKPHFVLWIESRPAMASNMRTSSNLVLQKANLQQWLWKSSYQKEPNLFLTRRVQNICNE